MRYKKGSVVWMEVTQDEYRLPVVIADTSRELAKICGDTNENVRTTAYKTNKGLYKNSKSRYIVVVLNEED